MAKTHLPRFFKCYAALVGAFDPAEVIFILYMEQQTALVRMGYSSTRSQQYHMMRMSIGRRLFKKYIEKFSKMKLLIMSPTADGGIDFCIDTLLYEKLVLALDNFRSTIQARKFCDEYFGGKEVVPLTNLDSDMLDEWNKKYAMKSITAFSIQPISD